MLCCVVRAPQLHTELSDCQRLLQRSEDEKQRLQGVVGVTESQLRAMRDEQRRRTECVQRAKASQVLCFGPSLWFAHCHPGGIGQALCRDLAPNIGLKFTKGPKEGLLVTGVKKRSPGRAAGVKKGDIVGEVNGRPVASKGEFNACVRAAGVGSTVSLQVLRVDNSSARAKPIIRTLQMTVAAKGFTPAALIVVQRLATYDESDFAFPLDKYEAKPEAPQAGAGAAAVASGAGAGAGSVAAAVVAVAGAGVGSVSAALPSPMGSGGFLLGRPVSAAPPSAAAAGEAVAVDSDGAEE